MVKINLFKESILFSTKSYLILNKRRIMYLQQQKTPLQNVFFTSLPDPLTCIIYIQDCEIVETRLCVTTYIFFQYTTMIEKGAE